MYVLFDPSHPITTVLAAQLQNAWLDVRLVGDDADPFADAEGVWSPTLPAGLPDDLRLVTLDPAAEGRANTTVLHLPPLLGELLAGATLPEGPVLTVSAADAGRYAAEALLDDDQPALVTLLGADDPTADTLAALVGRSFPTAPSAPFAPRGELRRGDRTAAEAWDEGG